MAPVPLAHEIAAGWPCDTPPHTGECQGPPRRWHQRPPRTCSLRPRLASALKRRPSDPVRTVHTP